MGFENSGVDFREQLAGPLLKPLAFLAGQFQVEPGLVRAVLQHQAGNPKRPEYTAVKSGFVGGGPPTIAPSLRFQPDPLFDGKGVLVDKVVAGGPADKAGLKEGDIIIEMAGKAVANVTMYTVVRATLKSGVEIDVKILRDKKELTLKVTPVTLK